MDEAKKDLSRSYASVMIGIGGNQTFTNTHGKWLTSDFCSHLKDLVLFGINVKFAESKLIHKTFQALHQLENLSFNLCDIYGFDNSKQNRDEAVLCESLKTIELDLSHFGVS